MVKYVFTNHKQFALLYFSILLIDIFVKIQLPIFPYRYITKLWLLPLLMSYFYFNKIDNDKKKHRWLLFALSFFFIGDILVINHTNIISLSLSLLFFSVGKIFFCIKFSHKKDFNVSRLIPFTIIMFGYVIFIIGYLYKDLKAFLVPALFSFFLTLLMFQFAYLRKDVFNKKSYLYVFFGIILFIISEGIMAIKTFKTDIPYQDFLIMLFYGLSIYLIVFGVINEKKEELEFGEIKENEISSF
ncbi:YhhN-like protein [Flaviramulus basaltis]|uniref:YhhN-like protein n=1 Tax=Flaviramulus basaltis TaxID=369401 RepID=A0A1K2ILG6_9FLAO|nr:lysoplasmalogenase family protein [Flaviramulus basaltis]SFZ92515.1 YhhN-like protein [Flaviramulus basaltis]